MARLVLNRDGGKTDEFGHILGLSRFTTGEVIEGLNVTAQSSPNMTVKVDAGSAKIPYGTGGTRYDYWVANDADYNVTIATADPANPRIDYIIGVVDRTVTPSTGVTNNSNNMFKIIAVAGTPAASPSVPSGAQLQTAAGTGNPYILLRRVNVPAGVTQITSGQISTDLRNIMTIRNPASAVIGQLGTAYNYTSSTTWTKPVGLKYVVVHVVGGGASGSGANFTGPGENSISGGGGGGGYGRKKIMAASLGTTETVTVGAGGAVAGIGAQGNAGGNSSFGAHVTANGGSAGDAPVKSSTNLGAEGGNGGTTSDADLGINGQKGGSSRAIAGGTVASYSDGGNSGYGGAGGRGTINASGNAGSFPGGGGAAANLVANQSPSKSGSAGANGLVIVEEYY